MLDLLEDEQIPANAAQHFVLYWFKVGQGKHPSG
jgi:hypothetical protein